MLFLTVDVEEWFNILDISGAIPLELWDHQEKRLPENMERLLELFQRYQVKVTFFWLSYFAERYPELVRRCHAAGHEIASHGDAHLLAYQVGIKAFREDIRRSKKILEDIISAPVYGFRAAGFSITDESRWSFEEIRAAGYLYDSSTFPASRGHGGMPSMDLGPHWLQTEAGPLLEIPQSMIKVLGKRISVFGGGYMRLAPVRLIKQGIKILEKKNLPVILYVHPREIDSAHPRLQMNYWRRFKSYVNLESTYPKLEECCRSYTFSLMKNLLPTGVVQ